MDARAQLAPRLAAFDIPHMPSPPPAPERPPAASATVGAPSRAAESGVVSEATETAGPHPPGLGGLLMVVGGALCVAGGVFIAFGAEALVTISPGAATVFLKGTPLVVGGAMVAIGARVRRALSRAYLAGVEAGRQSATLSGDLARHSLQAGPRDAVERQARQGKIPPAAGA